MKYKLYFSMFPLEVCLERNHKRERTVADDVMRRMSAKLKATDFRGRLFQNYGGQGEAEVRAVIWKFLPMLERSGG